MHFSLDSFSSSVALVLTIFQDFGPKGRLLLSGRRVPLRAPPQPIHLKNEDLCFSYYNNPDVKRTAEGDLSFGYVSFLLFLSDVFIFRFFFLWGFAGLLSVFYVLFCLYF